MPDQTTNVQAPSLGPEPAPRPVGVGDELGDYLLTSHICAGGMGEIYAAVHLRLDRDVAIKLPRPHATCGSLFDDRLREEARFLAQVAHPNVVQVFDLRRAPQGFHFMVLELLRGRALDVVVARREALPVTLGLEILRQAAEGVAAVHRAGIVGIDVKPENVMVVDGPLIGARRDAQIWVKLIDLGTARGCREAAPRDEAPLGLGTPAYLAPELVQGEHAVAATDIYSLGLLLYEVLTGDNPFLRGNAQNVLERHIHYTPPLLSACRPDLSPGSALEQLAADALAKEPTRRPPSAEAFLDRLEVATEQWMLHHAPRWRDSRPVPRPLVTVQPERETQRLPLRAAQTPPPQQGLRRHR